MHTQRERVWVSSLERRNSVKRLYSSVLPGLFPFRPIMWFLFPHLTYLGTLPWVHRHPSVKMDLEVKASGRSKTHYGLVLSSAFWPTKGLSEHV